MKFLLTMVIATALAWGSTVTAYGDYTSSSSPSNENYNADVIDSNDAELLDRDPYNNFTDANDVVESYTGLPERIRSHGERVFIFSPRLLRWAAYDADGYLVASGKANGGSHYCADLGRPCRTPIGVFRVGRKGTAACVSKSFPVGQGGAPMPYCMFFSGGNAIHGSPYISNRNTSHGCIRVHTGAAAWLHKHFMRPGTKVLVLPY